MAEPITWVAFGITAWEILRHTFRRLARHEEQRYRQWDGKYDGEGWERRHCHLHLVKSDTLQLFDQDQLPAMSTSQGARH